MLEPHIITLFAASFTTFFVVIDAIGVAPIFASLTKGGPPAYARKMAIRAMITSMIILIGFAFGGAILLEYMHISLDAFRIAGGVLLFLIALEMVFEKRTEKREERADTVREDAEALEDISIFPIAIPMLAGPGSIASAMLFMQRAEGDVMAQGAVLLAIILNLVLCAAIFIAARPLLRLMGEAVATGITRILGVILAALSAQLIIDGIIGAFSLNA